MSDTGVPWFVWLVFGMGCMGAALTADSVSCSSKAKAMGFPSDYGPFQGCMIYVDRHWIPLESYRMIGGAE